MLKKFLLLIVAGLTAVGAFADQTLAQNITGDHLYLDGGTAFDPKVNGIVVRYRERNCSKSKMFTKPLASKSKKNSKFRSPTPAK